MTSFKSKLLPKNVLCHKSTAPGKRCTAARSFDVWLDKKPVHIREHVSTARNQSNVDETRETARALKADLESKDAKRAESSLTDLYAESRTQVIELLLDRFHPGKVHGLKSDDLVERIEATPLHPHFKEISLRRYQAFGAKFALAQERVLLGDEMGLGKDDRSPCCGDASET